MKTSRQDAKTPRRNKWKGLLTPSNQLRLKIMFDLIAHLQRQKAFSLKTFGSGPRIQGITDHIRKELLEVESEPNSLEWIDIVILALDGAWRAGFTPEQIAAAIEVKQIENEERDWPDFRDFTQDQPIEHIRQES